MTEAAVRTDRPRPRKRARSVSYWMTSPGCPRPQRRARPRSAARRATAAGGSPASAPTSGDELGLHEQVLEGRMRDVGGLRRQDDLGVRRQLDLAAARAEIGQRHRRISASCSAETTTVSAVAIEPSRRENSALLLRVVTS